MEEDARKKKNFKKIARKILIALLIVTLYSNIGWMIGSYYQHHIAGVKAENLTTFAKAASGGWAFFSDEYRKSGWGYLVFFGILWPLGLLFVVLSWIIYGLYYAVYYVAWFMFLGGAAKLLGLLSC